MADEIEGATGTAEEHGESGDSFVNFIEEKYGARDDARRDAEDGVSDDSGSDDDDAGAGGEDAEDDGAADQTEPGTSDDGRDGAASESGEESAGDDGADHTEDELSEESGDDDEATAEDDDAEEVDDQGDDGADISDDLQAAADKHGIPLTLDDIADPTARALVAQKVKAMDAGLTRALQEARAYRTDEAQFRAEQKFQRENPALFVAQLLLENPDLFDQVNARMEKLDDEDQKEAFKVIVKDKRKGALDAVNAEFQQAEQLNTRAEYVETFARKESSRLGLPFELAERAVVMALQAKPEGKRDLTDAEIKAAIAAEHKVFEKATRGAKRTASREVLQSRAAHRRPVSPALKPSKGSQTPAPARARRAPELDVHDSEGRVDQLLGSIRRIKPGTK